MSSCPQPCNQGFSFLGDPMCFEQDGTITSYRVKRTNDGALTYVAANGSESTTLPAGTQIPCGSVVWVANGGSGESPTETTNCLGDPALATYDACAITAITDMKDEIISKLPAVDCTIQGEDTEVIDEENSPVYFTQQEFTGATGDGWTFNIGAANNFATFAGGQAFSLIETLPAVAISQSVPSGSYLRIYATGAFSSVFAFVNGNPIALTQAVSTDPAYKLYQYPASNAGDTIRFQLAVADLAQPMTLDKLQIVQLVTKTIPGEVTVTQSLSVKLDDCTKEYLDNLLAPKAEYTRQPISWCESDGSDPPLYTRYDGTQVHRWDGVNVVETVYLDATNTFMFEPSGWRYV